MTKSKAESISVGDLQAAVERAVKLAARENIRLQGPFATHAGIIFGRVLQESISFDAAEKAAQSITDNVSAAAKDVGLPNVVPAVLKLPGRIIVGFVDQRNARLLVE